MSVQQVVTPGNLGAEFDMGLEEANQIHVKVDGTTVVRAADGTLQAVQLVLNGDGTVRVTPADGSAAWSFDPCCSKPWEKYQGKVCGEVTVTPVVGVDQSRYDWSVWTLDGSAMMMTASINRHPGVGGDGPMVLGAEMETTSPVNQPVVSLIQLGGSGAWATAGDGLTDVQTVTLRFDNAAEYVKFALFGVRASHGHYLDGFSRAPTAYGTSVLNWDGTTLTPAVATTINTLIEFDYTDDPFDELSFTIHRTTGFVHADPGINQFQVLTKYLGPAPNTSVLELFVWDDDGTTLYQSVLDGAMVTNPTIVACP
ncbi:MAG: hypothetical protein H6641_16195 [Caldilineaceae bacterium]|nr:hypothetical protein [Caldilineaceae bacterium]